MNKINNMLFLMLLLGHLPGLTTILHDAAEFGGNAKGIQKITGYQSLRELVENTKIDVNSRQRWTEYTPLHLAAREGQVSSLEELLDLGADIEATVGGNTSLHLAATFGKDKIIEVLLRKGANKEAQNRHGQTALHLAIADGRECAAKALLDAKVNIEARDTNGNTPIHGLLYPLYSTPERMLNILLSNGASLKAKDNFGRTVVSKVGSKTVEVIRQLAIEYQADVLDKDKKRLDGKDPGSFDSEFICRGLSLKMKIEEATKPVPETPL
jgi:ankyrin repeat protein